MTIYYNYNFDALSKLLQKDRDTFIENFEVKKRIPVKDKNYEVNNKNFKFGKIKAISLFSGAGGLDIASHLSGVEVISSLDFDKDSIETLKLNKIFSNSKIFHEDIRNINSKNYSQMINKKKFDKLIFLGGPPCQPFSKAGYWVTHENRLGKKDPRNMISEYLRIIGEIKPDGFILENVESILHPKNLNVINEIENFMSKNKYHFIKFQADATKFGVPQKRKRVFFMASKKKFTGLPSETHGDNLKEYERVIDWIYKFDIDKYKEISESVIGKTYEKELYQVPPGKNYFALTSRDGHPNPKFEANKRFWSFLLKLNPFKTSWTIPAQPGPWVGPLHWDNRRLRVPEISSIQTFPQDYLFFGSRRSIQKQIGNAVPPLLGKAMIDFLIKNL